MRTHPVFCVPPSTSPSPQQIGAPADVGAIGLARLCGQFPGTPMLSQLDPHAIQLPLGKLLRLTTELTQFPSDLVLVDDRIRLKYESHEILPYFPLILLPVLEMLLARDWCKCQSSASLPLHQVTHPLTALD